MAKLKIDQIRKSFGKTDVLKGVNIDIADGEFIVLLGASGCGKSTLLRIIAGLETQTSGHLSIGNQVVDNLPPARRGIAMVFQSYALYPHLDVAGNWAMGLKQAGESNELIAERTKEAARILAMENLLKRKPSELSGGQRQRVMVARAVLLRPKMIVADEPVSMVDASLRATILDELRTLNRELGISIVYITHDLTTAFQICDNIVVLYRGTVAEAGAVEQVIGKPRHPYSQLLVSSIPLPDLSKAWGGEEIPVTEANATRPNAGCKFAPRCPHVMEECWQAPPPKYMPDAQRLATCFLYRDAPVSPDADVASVFRPPLAAPVS